MKLFVRARTSWKFLLVSLLSLTLAIPALPATAGYVLDADNGARYTFSRTERCVMRRINRIRARHGLHRLDRDKQLGFVARDHARTMARAGDIWHDANVGSEITRWIRLGQNTGRGRGCKSLTRSFMQSDRHRAHVLGQFRFFGVGTERHNGRLYVQELFESRRDPGNIYRYP